MNMISNCTYNLCKDNIFVNVYSKKLNVEINFIGLYFDFNSKSPVNMIV